MGRGAHRKGAGAIQLGRDRSVERGEEVRRDLRLSFRFGQTADASRSFSVDIASVLGYSESAHVVDSVIIFGAK